MAYIWTQGLSNSSRQDAHYLNANRCDALWPLYQIPLCLNKLTSSRNGNVGIPVSTNKWMLNCVQNLSWYIESTFYSWFYAAGVHVWTGLLVTIKSRPWSGSGSHLSWISCSDGCLGCRWHDLIHLPRRSTGNCAIACKPHLWRPISLTHTVCHQCHHTWYSTFGVSIHTVGGNFGLLITFDISFHCNETEEVLRVCRYQLSWPHPHLLK